MVRPNVSGATDPHTVGIVRTATMPGRTPRVEVQEPNGGHA